MTSYKFTFITCFIALISFMGGTIYVSAFPELGFVFNTSSRLIKFSLTIYFMGMVCGTILAGLLADTYGRTLVLKWFLLLFSFASLFCGFASSIYWFLGGRFLQGVGTAAGPIIIIALAARQYKGLHYHKQIAYILMMMGLGPGIAPIAGSFILHFFTWKGIFHVLTGLGILAFVLVHYIKIERRPQRRRISETLLAYRFFITHPLFLHYCLMVGMIHGAWNVFIIISPYILRLDYGWGIIDFVWVGLAFILGKSFEPYFKKIESQNTLLTGLVIVAGAIFMFLVFGLPSHGIWFLLIANFFLIGANLTSSWLTIEAVKVHSQYTGIASSLFYFSKYTLCSTALILVLFMPATLWTINIFMSAALLICISGYLKIR